MTRVGISFVRWFALRADMWWRWTCIWKTESGKMPTTLSPGMSTGVKPGWDAVTPGLRVHNRLSFFIQRWWSQRQLRRTKESHNETYNTKTAYPIQWVCITYICPGHWWKGHHHHPTTNTHPRMDHHLSRDKDRHLEVYHEPDLNWRHNGKGNWGHECEPPGGQTPELVRCNLCTGTRWTPLQMQLSRCRSHGMWSENSKRENLALIINEPPA